MSAIDPRVLVLHDGDNVGVAAVELPVATELHFAGRRILLQQRIDVGHKFALRDISAGERILKYSAPIGRATRAIEIGRAHV